MRNNNYRLFNFLAGLSVVMTLILSRNAFAAPGGVAMQAELDAEIADRQVADTAEAAARLNADAAELAARQSADAALQINLDNAVATQATIDAGQNETIKALQTKVAKLEEIIAKFPKKVGDSFGGGIVFHVDQTGLHGLIASQFDLTDGVDEFVQWYNGIFKTTGALGSGIGAGATNTTFIVAAQTADDPLGVFAAKTAADFSVQEDGVTPCTGETGETCYGDWYLPSMSELIMIYENLHLQGLGGLADDEYWSSTEADVNTAWIKSFQNGINSFIFKHNSLRVRAVRTF